MVQHIKKHLISFLLSTYIYIMSNSVLNASNCTLVMCFQLSNDLFLQFYHVLLEKEELNHILFCFPSTLHAKRVWNTKSPLRTFCCGVWILNVLWIEFEWMLFHHDMRITFLRHILFSMNHYEWESTERSIKVRKFNLTSVCCKTFCIYYK